MPEFLIMRFVDDTQTDLENEMGYCLNMAQARDNYQCLVTGS